MPQSPAADNSADINSQDVLHVEPPPSTDNINLEDVLHVEAPPKSIGDKLYGFVDDVSKLPETAEDYGAGVYHGNIYRGALNRGAAGIAAAGMKAQNYLTGEGQDKSFGDYYKQTTKSFNNLENELYNEAKARSPVATTSGDVTGAYLSASTIPVIKVAQNATKVLKGISVLGNIGIGAGTGAATNSLDSEQPVDPEKAKEGAIIGGGIQAAAEALPYTKQVAKIATNPHLLGLIGASEHGAEGILRGEVLGRVIGAIGRTVTKATETIAQKALDLGKNKLGDFYPILESAAKSGKNTLAATHIFLDNTAPEYKQIISDGLGKTTAAFTDVVGQNFDTAKNAINGLFKPKESQSGLTLPAGR